MAVETKLSLFRRLLYWLPVMLLFISVLNEFDFNYLNYYYFSFNFPFILIYYFCLKRTESLGYGYIFIAGLFNDVVVGFPLGLSSFTYLLVCLFAAYLKNITLRPRLLNDWLFFLFICLLTILLLLKLFGEVGIFIYTVIAIISANIQVLKIVEFPFFSNPIALGTILFSSTW